MATRINFSHTGGLSSDVVAQSGSPHATAVNTGTGRGESVAAVDGYMTESQLASRYAMSMSTARRRRKAGDFPAVTPIGGLIRYHLADCRAWELAQAASMRPVGVEKTREKIDE